MTSLSNSHFISKGTPGSAMTTPRGSSTMKDGAVPFGFSTGIAPSGMYAWRELLAVMTSPRRWNRCSIWSSRSRSSTSRRPVTAATVSRVRSSRVGPSPPPVMTMSDLSSARPRTAFMRAGLSPTVVLKYRSTPTLVRRWAIHAPLVSTICPSSSSDPMDTISALGISDLPSPSLESAPCSLRRSRDSVRSSRKQATAMSVSALPTIAACSGRRP